MPMPPPSLPFRHASSQAGGTRLAERRLRVISRHISRQHIFRHLTSSNGAANARLTSRADFTRAHVMAALDVHGYCILERYVDDPAALRRDFDDTLLPRTPTGRNRFEGSKTRRCYSLFAKTRAFDTLACDPLLLDCVGAALGSKHFLFHSRYIDRPRRDRAATSQRRRQVPGGATSPRDGAELHRGDRRFQRGKRWHAYFPRFTSVAVLW